MKKEKLFARILTHMRERKEETLIFCMFALSFICAVLDRFWLHRSDEFLGTLIFEFIIFLIPLFVYFMLTYKTTSPKKLAREMNVAKITYRLVFLPVISAFLLICGSLVLDMLFFGVLDITDGFTLYGQFTANGDGSVASHVYMIIAFAIIPAFFEEIVFRKLLSRKYTSKGFFPAVAICAMFYALTPFSLRLIPSFLFSGVIYCLIFMLTGSLVASCTAHIIFNLYCIYLRTNVANYFIGKNDPYLLVMAAIILFLLSLVFFLGVIYRLLIGYARANKTPPSVPKKRSAFAHAFGSAFSVFKSPINIATLVIYVAFIVVFGFFG